MSICPLACESSADCTSILGPAQCPARSWPAVEPTAEQPALSEDTTRRGGAPTGGTP